MTKLAPFGSWKSPITSDVIVCESIGLGLIKLDGDDTYWIEMRPSEGGRQVIVRLGRDGHKVDITPPEFNARTRVHEYGGCDYAVLDGVVYFSNFSDQQIYKQTVGSAPQVLTAGSDSSLRYADAIIDAKRNRLICVREDHRERNREAVNAIAAISLAGSDTQVLVSGNDFYSSPRISTDGS